MIHIDCITSKVRKLFSGFIKLTNTIRIVYKLGLVLPIVCYSAAGCAVSMYNHDIRKL